MKKLLVLVAILLVAYVVHRQRQLEPGPVAADPAASAASAPREPERTSWQRAELAEVRGTIVAVTPEEVVVQIDPPISDAAARKAREAGSSSGIGLANAATVLEQREYGSRMALQNGQLRVTDFVPEVKAQGRVRVKGHPNLSQLRDGMKVKLVAAPLYHPGKGRIFNYRLVEIPPAAAGDWFKKVQEKNSQLPQKR